MSASTLNCRRCVLVLLLAAGACSTARADSPFEIDADEYVAGVRQHGLDEDTRVMGWQIGDNFYFGRRHGDVDDFGFVLQRGDTQFSLTEAGIGWRKSISLFH